MTVGDTRPLGGLLRCGRDGCGQAGSRCSLSLLRARAAQRLQAGHPGHSWSLLWYPSPAATRAGPSRRSSQVEGDHSCTCLSSPWLPAA